MQNSDVRSFDGTSAAPNQGVCRADLVSGSAQQSPPTVRRGAVATCFAAVRRRLNGIRNLSCCGSRVNRDVQGSLAAYPGVQAAVDKTVSVVGDGVYHLSASTSSIKGGSSAQGSRLMGGRSVRFYRKDGAPTGLAITAPFIVGGIAGGQPSGDSAVIASDATKVKRRGVAGYHLAARGGRVQAAGRSRSDGVVGEGGLIPPVISLPQAPALSGGLYDGIECSVSLPGAVGIAASPAECATKFKASRAKPTKPPRSFFPAECAPAIRPSTSAFGNEGEIKRVLTVGAPGAAQTFKAFRDRGFCLGVGADGRLFAALSLEGFRALPEGTDVYAKIGMARNSNASDSEGFKALPEGTDVYAKKAMASNPNASDTLVPRRRARLLRSCRHHVGAGVFSVAKGALNVGAGVVPVAKGAVALDQLTAEYSFIRGSGVRESDRALLRTALVYFKLTGPQAGGSSPSRVERAMRAGGLAVSGASNICPGSSPSSESDSGVEEGSPSTSHGRGDTPSSHLVLQGDAGVVPVYSGERLI